MITASTLLPGDVFVECSPADYEAMSKRERGAFKRTTFERVLGACGNADRIHVRTSRGDWCIPETSPVTVIEHVSTPARGAERAA